VLDGCSINTNRYFTDYAGRKRNIVKLAKIAINYFYTNSIIGGERAQLKEHLLGMSTNGSYNSVAILALDTSLEL